MPEIVPFRGICFDTERVDLNRATCPPYDTISPGERRELLQQDEHNAVRLVLGDGEEWHAQAAGSFQTWMEQGILRRDPEPAIYSYAHRFSLEGRERTRRGCVALLRLAERSEREVLPHEHTFEGPKADRFKLTQACEANLEPIFLLAADPQGRMRQALAEAETTQKVVDPKGVEHTFGRITDLQIITSVQDAMRGQKVFIADGHHRYETAQNYRDWRRQQSPNDPPDAPYNYQMVYFCPMEDEGLHILPTHRIVGGIPEAKLKALDSELAKYFKVEPALHRLAEEFARALRSWGQERPAIGLYRPDGSYTVLSPKAAAIEKYVGDSTRTITWRNLDVSILHELVLHRILGIPRDRLLDHVKYLREASEGVRLVNEGGRQLAFLLNGTRVEQVRRICLEGEHMPQKSTDFYPKLLTGLVFYKF